MLLLLLSLFLLLLLLVVVAAAVVVVEGEMFTPQNDRVYRIKAIMIGWHYLSKAACLMRPHLLCVCVFRRVKDHRNLLHYSPPLKKTCFRQVVLDK